MTVDNKKRLVQFLLSYIEMTQPEIDSLNQVVISKSFKKKEIILREGDVLKYLAFIVKGAVRFYYIDEKGVEQTFEFAFENMPIGQYHGLLSEAKSNAYVEAIEETTLLGISKDNFIQFLNQFPQYYAVITEVMGKALVDHEVRNKLLRIPSSNQRYQEFCKFRPEVIQRVPLTYIASYLKMALGTLSRVRAGKL